MRIITDRNALDPILAEQWRNEILAIPDSEWFRYDNPFERKTAMGAATAYHNHSDSVNYVSAGLTSWLNAKTGFDLRPDGSGAFISIFKYKPGDYLKLHLDAECHPTSGAEKKMTVLLYLSTDDLAGGGLVFFRGKERPEVETFHSRPMFNTLVAFENTNQAWHGCDPVVQGTKIVVTASYLTDDEVVGGRKKAYFAPYPGDEWGEELTRLRDERADIKTAASVYRI